MSNDTTASASTESFAEWLAREMPAGTVISNPAWWAPRILRAALARAPLPETAPDPVVEANRQLLLDRSRVGVAKYGVTLAAAGLPRDQLMQHALEEALDLANYLQTLLLSAAPAQADEARDAARYRWLRDSGEIVAGQASGRIAIPMYTPSDAHKEELDKHIDASIAASLAGKDKK